MKIRPDLYRQSHEDSPDQQRTGTMSAGTQGADSGEAPGNMLHTRISAAIDAAMEASEHQVVAMPELGEGATGLIEPRQDVSGIGRIVVRHAGITPSLGYLASAAARLARKVNVEKAGQGRKGKWDPARTAAVSW
jgi:hypothetical protein